MQKCLIMRKNNWTTQIFIHRYNYLHQSFCFVFVAYGDFIFFSRVIFENIHSYHCIQNMYMCSINRINIHINTTIRRNKAIIYQHASLYLSFISFTLSVNRWLYFPNLLFCVKSKQSISIVYSLIFNPLFKR